MYSIESVVKHFIEHKSHRDTLPSEDLHSEECSNTAKTSMSRLDQIRSKIATGFYLSEEIEDDICEKLGKILDDYE